MGVCDNTDIYANDVICDVMGALDDLTVIANDLKNETLLALGSLKTTSEGGVANLAGITYSADTSGVPLTFTAPTTNPQEPDFSSVGPTAPTAPTLEVAPTVGTSPTIPAAFVVPTTAVDAAPVVPAAYVVGSHSVGAPPTLPPAYNVPDAGDIGDPPAIPAGYVVPDADSMLITDTVFDDLYDKAAGRLARVGAKEERDAVYMASAMGLGLPSASLMKRLERAQHGINTKTSEVALEHTVNAGVWKREDVKTLHGMHIQNWPLKPELDVKAYQIQWSLQTELYTAETGANIQGWPLSAQLALEAYKAQEGLETDAYKAETGANVQNWSLRPGLEQAAHKTTESLEIEAYKTHTNASIANWPEHTKLATAVWQTQGQLDSTLYKTAEDAKNSNYSSQVSGFGSEVQWTLGYLNAESQRFAARLDELKAELSQEAERRGWSQLELQGILTQADKTTGYAIDQAKAILATTQQAEEAISQFLAGLTQAVYSAANYNLSGRGSQSVSESV